MARSAPLLAVVLAPALAAQSFFVPDNDPLTGSCNVFPLGSTGGANLKYQTLVTAADLANQAGLITGLGFAQCGQGVHHFDTIEVLLDHTTASALTTTFANNISASAVTVLSATNYDWNVGPNSWSDIGLQDAFAYDGVRNIVLQITVTGSEWAQVGGLGSAGLRAGARQRLFANNWPTVPPATGTLSSSLALKVELDMGMAKVSSHGRGCQGSNLLLPEIGIQGVPQLGQTVAFTVTNAIPLQFAAAVWGFDNHSPFPLDLTTAGLANCLQYFAIDSFAFLATDGAGNAVGPSIPVPSSAAFVGRIAYAQWACADAAANAFGMTTSNYLRVQVGN